MNRIVITNDTFEEIFTQKKKKSKRGALTYGIPVCPEIANFVEDVSPEAVKQRLISMFFSGNCSLVDDNDYSEEDFMDIPFPEDIE